MPKRYEPVTMERQAEYAEHFAACPQKASDYSFVNLWGWAKTYGLEWAFDDDLVWIRQTSPEPVCWAPVGNWGKVDWQGRLASMGEDKRFIRVPEALATIWSDTLPGRLESEEARGHWDYLYLVSDLVELKGNKFHKKKNLLAQFRKSYDWIYQELTPDCVEEVLGMQLEWCSWRECLDAPSLVAENAVIDRVLKSWDRLGGLIGGTIRVDGTMVAYTVAEALSPDTVVIHFEKGQPGYKGVYQAINSMFLAETGSRFTYVNREQDLDDEGLRKAKLSYNPVGFLKKFTTLVKV